MASFSAGTTFTDGVANDVTAAKLAALVNAATPTSGFIQDRTSESTIAADDTLLFGDFSDSSNLKRMTVANFAGTLPTATITTLNSTTGTIATLNSTTGTIATLNSTTGTITGLSSTTGTIATLNSTTPTFLGAITASTNTINIGSGQIVKESSGNVGISVTPALFRLQVGGDIALTDTSSLHFATAGGTIRSSILGDSSQNLKFQTVGTERLRIDSSGNVGIGTTPSRKLDVNGVAAATYLMLTSNTASAPAVDAAITRIADGTLGLITNSAERLRIDSSGNVGIGTTSPGAKFGVSDGTVNIQLSPDSANSRGVIATAGGHSIAFAPNGTTRLTIDQANGTLTSQPTYDNTAAGSDVIVTSTGLVRRTSSSIKYKKDVENLYGSIVDNAIDRLRPVWYRTKNPEGDDKSTWSHVGLIAEEVDSVEPRLVRYKTAEVSIGENGERIETQLENPVPEDVDYAKLSVILLSEVKAQRIKIASLEARLEALEAK